MNNSTKQQSLNTFTGGLNTDLHPLTTPNDILTDCINGTVITYNGNEYILQNDMGNYKLEKAVLPADYIPVGIKEYGNIIYIVSYNPLDKKCQIGSYPSPQTLFNDKEYNSKEDTYNGIIIPNLDSNWTWPISSEYTTEDGVINGQTELDKSVLFTNIKPKQNLNVFLSGTTKEDTFLNPGDMYYLQKDDNNEWKFQKCDYYVLTESNEAIKIKDGLVEEDNTEYAPEKLKNVKWETPGWLSYKSVLLEPESFDLYMTNINIPSFLTSNNNGELTGTLSFHVQGQLTLSNDENWQKYYNNIKVYFDYSYKDGSWYKDFDKGSHIDSENNGVPVNYGNNINILTFNNSKQLHISKADIENNKTVVIRATPYIIEGSSGIVYNNLSVTYTINLGELYNINEIKALNTIYKYYVSKDDISINFNIVSPTSNNSQITCKYRIHEINDTFTAVSSNTGYKDIDSLSLLGQNILTINFKEEASWFKKEEIYVFELAFFDAKDWTKYVQSGRTSEIHPIYQVAEFLFTSSIFNDFYTTYNLYQSISLKEWTSKIYNHTYIDKNVNITGIENEKSYCRYAKLFDSNSLFELDYYNTQLDNWRINSPENPSDIKEEDISEKNIKKCIEDNIIGSDDSNIKSSCYYGVLGAYIGNLGVNIAAPIIADTNTGLWENINWSTDVNYTIKNNTGTSTKQYLYNTSSPINLTTGQIIKDTTASIINSSGVFNLYNSSLYEGKEYDKWYFYKNLLPLNEICKNWLPTIINQLPSNIEKREELANTLESLKTLSSNSEVVSLSERRAITYLHSYGSNDRRKFWLMLKNSSNYDFSNFTLVGGTSNYWANDGGGVAGDYNWPSLSDFDNWLNSRLASSNFTFIPVYFDSNGRGGGSYNNGSRRRWTFPDSWTGWHRSGDCHGSAAFAILCKQGNSVSTAIIRVFNDNDSNYKGMYYTARDGNFKSSFLVSNINDNKPNYLSNNMLYNFALFMLLLGVNLYGVYNITDDFKYYITDTGQTSIFKSGIDYNISYKRTDTINNISYKGIDFLNTKNLTDLEDVKDSFINSFMDYTYNRTNYNMSFNNIIGNKENKYIATKVTINTNSNNIIYNYPKAITDLSIVHSRFITSFNLSLQDIISKFIETKGYTDNMVLSDLNNDSKISRYLENMASLFKFEFKNKKGYIYYNGFPGDTFGTNWDDNYLNNIRWLDWSDVPWDEFYNGFTLSNDFKETELKQSNNE